MGVVKMKTYHKESYLPTKSFSDLLNEVMYGGYYAALGSPLLILSVSILLNTKCDVQIMAMSYLLPLIVYSYDYYKDLKKDNAVDSERTAFLSEKSKKYPLILTSYILTLIFLIFLFSNVKLTLFIMGLVVSGILYTTAFKGVTKRIPFFKNIYTAITWAMGGTFFLIFYYSMGITTPFLLIFLVIFIRILINIIFFDLKDIDADRNEGLKTLPAILGKKKSINFLHLLNMFSFLPILLGVYLGWIPNFALALLIFFFYVFYYIQKSENLEGDNLHRISHTMADSEFVMWPLVLIIAKLIIPV